jgi:hypothetical protein
MHVTRIKYATSVAKPSKPSAKRTNGAAMPVSIAARPVRASATHTVNRFRKGLAWHSRTKKSSNRWKNRSSFIGKSTMNRLSGRNWPRKAPGEFFFGCVVGVSGLKKERETGTMRGKRRRREGAKREGERGKPQQTWG